MIDDAQFQYFEKAYADQLVRQAQIRDSARHYTTFTATYTAFLLFISAKPLTYPLAELVLLALAVLSLAIGIGSSIWAAKVTRYEIALNPMRMADELENGISEEAFQIARVADYCVAWKRTRESNEKRARFLVSASHCFILGIIFHVLSMSAFVMRSMEQ